VVPRIPQHGTVLPVWRIHRAIGMGGDQLVPAHAGEDRDHEQGDGIGETRDSFHKELIDEVAPLQGAHDLVSDLKERGLKTVLASSSPQEELDQGKRGGPGRSRTSAHGFEVRRSIH
jgi:phosphoglycolate phosphatase-like HAD superfamily hydrolase